MGLCLGLRLYKNNLNIYSLDISLQNTPKGYCSEHHYIKKFGKMTIIFVTGANRGIGYAIVQAAAGKILDGTFILGCRSLEAGHDAAEKLRGLNSKAIFDVVQIDIEKDESILATVKYITEKYGQLDGQLPLCSTISMEADDPRSSYQQRCRGQPSKVPGSPRCSSQPQQCLQQRRRITCNGH